MKGYTRLQIILFVISAIVVISLIIASVFKYYTEEVPEKEIEYYDCGSSDFCFSINAKTCTPVKATITTIEEDILQGEIIEHKIVYEETVEGFDNGNCILIQTYTEETTREALVGLNMICKIPRSDLHNFEDYLYGHKITESCMGTLVIYRALRL